MSMVFCRTRKGIGNYNMELMTKLTLKKIKGQRIYFGFFRCPYCDSVVERQNSNGKRDKSCGCMARYLVSSNRNFNYKHGGRHTRLYLVLNQMKNRCYNKKTSAYKNYGGRGIYICGEWLTSFSKFKEWACSNGYKDNLTIDRIDNNGNYEPSNCRWVTRSVNSKYRQSTKLSNKDAKQVRKLYNNGSLTKTEIATMFNVTRTTIYYIIKNKQWKEELINEEEGDGITR